MSLAAESPSPSPSSSSGSDDFAALLDSELELASAVDSASPVDPSTSLTSSDDEENDDDDEEDGDDEDVVVEVEDAEQSRYAICNPHFVPNCWACLLRLCDQELLLHDSSVECASSVWSLADLVQFYLHVVVDFVRQMLGS